MLQHIEARIVSPIVYGTRFHTVLLERENGQLIVPRQWAKVVSGFSTPVPQIYLHTPNAFANAVMIDVSVPK